MKRSEVAKKNQKVKRGLKALRADERREREFTRGVPTHACLWVRCPHPAPAGSPWCYRHFKVMKDVDAEELLSLPPEEFGEKLVELANKMTWVR